ncbi:Uncharacterised protein, partial [Mycoplasmopsis edwardii]
MSPKISLLNAEAAFLIFVSSMSKFVKFDFDVRLSMLLVMKKLLVSLVHDDAFSPSFGYAKESIKLVKFALYASKSLLLTSSIPLAW